MFDLNWMPILIYVKPKMSTCQQDRACESTWQASRSCSRRWSILGKPWNIQWEVSQEDPWALVTLITALICALKPWGDFSNPRTAGLESSQCWKLETCDCCFCQGSWTRPGRVQRVASSQAASPSEVQGTSFSAGLTKPTECLTQWSIITARKQALTRIRAPNSSCPMTVSKVSHLGYCVP